MPVSSHRMHYSIYSKRNINNNKIHTCPQRWKPSTTTGPRTPRGNKTTQTHTINKMNKSNRFFSSFLHTYTSRFAQPTSGWAGPILEDQQVTHSEPAGRSVASLQNIRLWWLKNHFFSKKMSLVLSEQPDRVDVFSSVLDKLTNCHNIMNNGREGNSLGVRFTFKYLLILNSAYTM